MAARSTLEKTWGRVWDTEQMIAEFTVEYFLAPLVKVRRRVDGAPGTLTFQHRPRFYFNFRRDHEDSTQP
jgi:hypothetical protein